MQEFVQTSHIHEPSCGAPLHLLHFEPISRFLLDSKQSVIPQWAFLYPARCEDEASAEVLAQFQVGTIRLVKDSVVFVIIMAAGPGVGPHIRVFDGNTGQQLSGPIGSFWAYDHLTWQGGLYVAAADLNDDGFADIITGADAGGGSHVRAFSGIDGTELSSFMAFETEFFGGVRVAAGDVTGDGIPDIIAAAGPGGGPHVRVFDGTTAEQVDGAIGSYMAYDVGFTGGVFATTGDFDGLPGLEVVTAPGTGGGPHIRIASAADFDGTNFLGNFMAYAVDYLGGVSVATIDWNNDGNADIATGQLQGPDAEVRIFDGTSNLNDPDLLDSFTPLSDLSPPLNGGIYVAGTTENVRVLDDLFASSELGEALLGN